MSVQDFLLAILLSLSALPAQARGPVAAAGPPSDKLPRNLTGVGVEQRLGARIPLDLRFQDELGRPVLLSEIVRDQPLVLTFAYFRCPGLCPTVLSGLVDALREIRPELGKDFRALTIGINPKESPSLAFEKKRSYLARYGRIPISGNQPAWRFLTGREETIRKLAAAAGFRYRYDPREDEYSHASVVMVLTPEGRLSQYLFGVRYSPVELERAIAKASRAGIGAPLQQLLLYCFHFDPGTGRWTFRIYNLLRVLGALTVLMVAALLVRGFRKERSP